MTRPVELKERLATSDGRTRSGAQLPSSELPEDRLRADGQRYLCNARDNLDRMRINRQALEPGEAVQVG